MSSADAAPATRAGPIAATVIIPTKDRPALLDRCLRAILEQDADVNFEIIVVNDAGCSVDVEAFGAVTVLEGAGRGPAAARNLGVLKATGEIVLFTDDDAIPMPGWMSAALRRLADSADAIGVVGRVVSPAFDPLYEHSVRTDGGVGSFVTCNAAYRRSALDKVAGFDESFPYPAAEDRDLGYRLQAVGPVLFERDMVVVHPPRPVTARMIIRRARYLQSEWRLHVKHPQTRPPRWSIRWGPLVRLVRSWQRLLTEERVVQGSPRRACRFTLLASGQLLLAFGITLSRWRSRPDLPPAGPARHPPLRIAWIGPTPVPGDGAPGRAWKLITELVRQGCELDCYLVGSQYEAEGLSDLRGVRVISFDTGWRPERFYSNSDVTTSLTGQAAEAWARMRLAALLVEQHQLRTYDVLYQFSTIELLGLGRSIDALPPIVIHPERHAAGHLRRAQGQRHLTDRSQPALQRMAVHLLLATRARRQRQDIQLATRVLASSRFFGEQLVRDYALDPARLSVVPHPVHVHESRQTLGPRSPGPWRIAFLSGSSASADTELERALFRRLADLRDEIVLNLLGTEMPVSDFRALLTDHNIGPAHHRSDASPHHHLALLRDADLLIHLSRYDPLGLVVADALAHGVPVVATDEVGAAEDVSTVCCTVVPAGDVDALEKAVRSMVARLSAGDLHALRRAARSEAERLFAPQKARDGIFSALSAAAAERSGEQ